MADTKERPLGELFRELTTEIGTLVRKELELAQLELGQKLSVAGRHAAFIAAGGAVAYAGLLLVFAALVLVAVRLGLPAWVAALVVGAAAAVLGGVLVRGGLATLRRINPAPTETVRTAKETAEWMGHRTR